MGKMSIAGIKLPRIAIIHAIRACRKINVVTCLGGIEKKCIHCTVKGEATHYCYCDMWNSVVEPDGFCNYGEQEK